MYQKNTSTSRICCFGCDDIENPHHIFVSCDRFSDLRSNELTAIHTAIKNRLDAADINSRNQKPLLDLAKSIFANSDSWPLYSTYYYIGQIPKIGPLLPLSTFDNSVNHSRLIHNIASDLHLSSVRLASRIFGNLQKGISKRHAAIYDNTR